MALMAHIKIINGSVPVSDNGTTSPAPSAKPWEGQKIQVTEFSLKEKEDGFKLFGMQLGLLKNFDKEIEG